MCVWTYSGGCGVGRGACGSIGGGRLLVRGKWGCEFGAAPHCRSVRGRGSTIV